MRVVAPLLTACAALARRLSAGAARARRLAAGAALGRPHAAGAVLAPLLTACAAPAPPQRSYFPALDLHAPVFSAPQVLAEARRENFGETARAVVLALDERSSLRAVSDAARALRERGLSVAYWIDAPAAGELDVDARLAHARAILEGRPPADALFVPALQGRALPCGCSGATCGAVEPPDAGEPRAAARLVAALRGFAGGAIVVPVWADRGAGSATACAADTCRAAGCAAREALAEACVREAAPHLAVLFEPATFARARGQGLDLAVYAAARLAAFAKVPTGVAAGTPGATLAVLPARDLAAADLAAAIAGVRAARRSGWLLVHAPLAAIEAGR